MDNKKIPTWLGAAIIIIFAATALGFVLVYENKQSRSGIENFAIPVLKNNSGENEKETENKKEINQAVLDQKHKNISLSGKYTSSDNIIEFQYSPIDNSSIYEKDGIIQFIWPLETVKDNPTNFPSYNVITFNEKKYAQRPFLDDSQEGIMILDKKENETLEDTIKKIIQQQGKNPVNCKIMKEQNGEKEKAWIELAKEYNPTEKELERYPDFPKNYQKWLVVGAKTKELCSVFSPKVPSAAFFEYNIVMNKRKFIFEKLSGPDNSINFHSINFLPQK